MADLNLMLRLEALDRATKPLRNLQGAINDTSKVAAAQRKRLLELQRTLNNAPSSRAEFEQMQRTRREIERTTTALAQQERQIKLWARTRDARSSGKQMMASGAMQITGASAVAYGINSFMQEGETFDVTMSRVQALTRLDENSSELAALRENAKYLGATTWADPTQVAQGQAFYAMAGFKPSAIMKSMAGTLDLARAGEVDIGRAADIGSNILSAFGLDAGQMDRVGDILVGTFTRTNTNLEMLGETMKYVGPIAKGLGISLEEASAMTGVLGNVGIQGGEAGTAMRAIFSRLAAGPSMAKKELAKLGIKTTDQKGNMRNPMELLTEMLNKTSKMGNADRLKALTSIAGLEAASALSALIDKGSVDDLQKIMKELADNNGESKRLAKVMADNLAGDKEELSSAFSDWKIAIHEVNNLGLRELVQNITKVMNVIGDWTKQNPEVVSSLSKITGSALALVAAIGSITIAAGFLKFAFVGHPIITALTLAVFLGTQLYNNFDDIMELWNSSPAFRWIASLTAIGTGLALIIAFAMKFKVLLASAGFAKSATLFMTMAKGIKAMGLAMLTSPIFWALGLIAGLIYMVYKHWDSLVWFWNEGAGLMHKDIGNLLEKIPGIGGALKLVWDVMSEGLGIIKDVSSWIVLLITNTDEALLRLEKFTNKIRGNIPELYKPQNQDAIMQMVNKQPELADPELARRYETYVLNPNPGIEKVFPLHDFIELQKTGKFQESRERVEQYQRTMNQTNTIIVNGAGDPKSVGNNVVDSLKQSTADSGKLWDAH